MSTLQSLLTIGTANFERNYGFVSPHRVDEVELGLISNAMKEYSIRRVDTALSYSSEESNLPKNFVDFFHDKDVTTKISVKNMPPGFNEINVVEKLIDELEKKKIKKFSFILLHNYFDLFTNQGKILLDGLYIAKHLNITDGIGISLYNVQEAEQSMDIFTPDVIQLPLNVFDQRILSIEFLTKIRNCGITLQIRSIFLQGLLLTDCRKLDGKFNNVMSELLEWWKFVELSKKDPLDLCLQFIEQSIRNTRDSIKQVVIGVKSQADLDRIIGFQPSIEIMDFSGFASTSDSLTDPRKWQK